MAVLSPDDIRALFAQEAAIRLGQLDELLLQLERAPADQDLIRSVFREIHTIKGSAAISGLGDVSRVAHDLEELIEKLRSGHRPVTPDVIDILLTGVDQLRGLIADSEAGSRAEIGTIDPPDITAGQLEGPSAPVPAPDVATPPVVPPGPEHKLVAEPATSGRAQRFEEAQRLAAEKAGRAGPPEPAAAAVMVPLERLDELVELLGEAAAAHLRVGRELKDRFGIDPASSPQFNEVSRSLNMLQDRVMRTRMVPVSTITGGLARAVRDIGRNLGKDVRWQVEGGATELDRGVLNELAPSLMHLVRNAVDHGIEPPGERADHKPRFGTITLHARQLGSEVIIGVSDDGRGIDIDRVRRRAAALGIDTTTLSEDETLDLIFHPGLSTSTSVTDISGRGVGLDVVHSNVQAVRGRIEVHSEGGSGTEFRIVVPITLAVLQCLIVEVAGLRFALPFHRVVVTQAHDTSAEIQAEGRRVVWVEDHPVTVSGLAEALGLEPGGSATGPIVVLSDSTRQHAFRVDRLVGQRDVALKGLSRLLPHLPAVAGASIEPDGSIFAVLDPPGLIQRARHTRRDIAPVTPSGAPGRTHGRILVVDDALTVRELQRSILERAGFQVRLACDGVEALSKLAEEPADLILTDIEMPNMDGFALTEAVRAAPALANVPILILSSQADDAHRRRGLDAGADGYIQKSAFDEPSLLAAVNRLLGVSP